MFIRTKKRANGKISVQIVESFRKGPKVQQRIFRHIGQGETPWEVEELKKLAQMVIHGSKDRRQPVLPLYDPERIGELYSESFQSTTWVELENLREEQRIVEGITQVFGQLYRELRLEDLITGTRKDREWNRIFRSCVLSRLANPASKRRTASLLEEDYGIKIPLEKIYRMMDHVAKLENRVKCRVGETTKTLFPEGVDVLFFDVTTLYFESVRADELRASGYCKDAKFKEVNVVLALVTTSGGLPITYHLYPGKTYEGHTLQAVILEMKKSFMVSNVILVADRALFDEANLVAMEKEGIKFMVGARLKTMPVAKKEEILSECGYRPNVMGKEFYWTKETEYKGWRLIISYSSKRAKKDASDRQKLIERLLKKATDGKIPIKDLIPNYGSKKYITVAGGKSSINQEKIDQDCLWDGLHGVITNHDTATAEEILSRYRGLWQIEEAFRLSKHDLRFRPMFHWTPRRIRAHISICFVALAMAKQAVFRMAKQSKEMSFEQIRNELLHVQASIVKDTQTGNKFLIPSHTTVNQKKIYQVFGLKRRETPFRFEKAIA